MKNTNFKFSEILFIFKLKDKEKFPVPIDLILKYKN